MSPLIAAACSPYPRGLDSLDSIEPERKPEQTPPLSTPQCATPAGRLFVSVQHLPAREAAAESSMTSIVSFAETQAAEEAAPPSPYEASSHADDGDEPADEGEEEGEDGEVERAGEEDMVNALLALSQGRLAPTPAPRRAKRPSSSAAAGPLKRRGVADRASQFTCKHPGCGKLYGCPDAVRKHCRKAHYDWLRSLGPVGPAGYCSWEPCA